MDKKHGLGGAEVDDNTLLFLDKLIREIGAEWSTLTEFYSIVQAALLRKMGTAIQENDHRMTDQCIAALDCFDEYRYVFYLLAEERKAGEEAWITQRTTTLTPQSMGHKTETA